MNIKTKILVTKSSLNYDEGKCVFALRFDGGDIFCFIWVKDDSELRHGLFGEFVSEHFNTFGEAIFQAKKYIQMYLQRVVLIEYDETTKKIA
jgi:hypothetical protein